MGVCLCVWPWMCLRVCVCVKPWVSVWSGLKTKKEYTREKEVCLDVEYYQVQVSVSVSISTTHEKVNAQVSCLMLSRRPSNSVLASCSWVVIPIRCAGHTASGTSEEKPSDSTGFNRAKDVGGNDKLCELVKGWISVCPSNSKTWTLKDLTDMISIRYQSWSRFRSLKSFRV